MGLPGKRFVALFAALTVSLLAMLVVAGGASARNVYVSNSIAGGIAYFPTPAGTPVNTVGNSTFSAIGPAVSIGFTPNGAQGYAVQGGASGNNAVALFDPATNLVNAEDITSVGNQPKSIAVSPDGATAYVADNNLASVSIIDTATNTKTGTIPLGNVTPTDPAFAWDLAISPNGNRLYVTTRAPAVVTVVDTATNSVIDLDPGTPTTTDRISIPGALPLTSGIAITPDGSELYVANADAGGFGGNTVSVISTATNAVVGSPIAVGLGPGTLAITPDGSRVYVVNSNAATVSVIHTNDKSVEATAIPVGTSPSGIAITPDGTRAYVPDSNSGAGAANDHVTPINLLTNTALTPIELGDGAREGVAATPNQPPVAAFSATPAVTGSPTTFNAGTSTDPDGVIANATYDWDFGDGSPVLHDGGPTPSHTYGSGYTGGGTKSVTLTITDDEGCSTAFVYTGHTAYCNGKATAAKTSSVTIPTPPVTYPAVTTPPATAPPAAAPKKCKKHQKLRKGKCVKKKKKKK